MGKKDLGFGIVGCGVISDWHAKSVATISGAYLVGATDVNFPNCEKFCSEHGVSPFRSLEEMLSCSEIDVVSICVPSGLHATIAIAAANAGKHIIVEKPMALNLRDADAIIAACEDNDVKIAVISQIRFSKAINVLKSAVENGDLGKIVTGDVFMKFFRSPEYYASANWRGTYKMDGGGALMNQGIHGIDGLTYVMGDIKSVFAFSKTLVHDIEVEDTCSAVLEYKNGAIGIIQGTTSVYPGYPRIIEISGTRGTIALQEDTIVKWDTENKEMPDGITIGTTKASGASDPKAISMDGHIMQIHDMIEAIRENRRPKVDAYEGRRPIKIITAIYESQKRGTVINLDDFNG